WTDSLDCACPSLRSAIIRFNDRCGDHPAGDERRTRILRPVLEVVAGTRGSTALTERRGWVACDWGIRVATPRILSLTTLGTEWAPKLAALAPIDGLQSLGASRELLAAFRRAAWARRDEAFARWRKAAESSIKSKKAEAAAAAEAAEAAEAAAEAAAAAAAAEAAEAAAAAAAEAAAAAAAAALPPPPELVAIAQAVLEKGGGYYDAYWAVRRHIQKTA